MNTPPYFLSAKCLPHILEFNFWLLLHKGSNTTSIEHAKRLLQDAQKQQEEAQNSKMHANAQLTQALGASIAAQRGVDNVDMFAGRILFFLQECRHPLSLCNGEHHLEVDHG
jgi:hypothetical protein